jgi:hypothetical protein
MNYLDFAPGYKTVAGIIVLVLSLAGKQFSNEEVLATVTAVGEAIGLALTAYGLVMKLYRKLKG